MNVDPQPPVPTILPAPKVFGCYDDICFEQVNLKPRGKKGILIAWIPNGFKNAIGQKDRVKWSTDERDARAAERVVKDEFIPHLQMEWREAAKTAGIPLDQKRKGKKKRKKNRKRDRPAQKGSLIAQGRAELERMTREKRAQSTHKGYASAFGTFAEHAPDAAFQANWKPNKGECEAIRDAMLAGRDAATNGPSKLMENVQYVLRRIDGFPADFYDIFTAKKGNARALQAKRQDYPFRPEERNIIWRNLKQAKKMVRGLILLLANTTQHATDVANLTVKELKEAFQDLTFWDRQKTGVYFRFVAWKELLDWIQEMNFSDEDIYVFDFVYSKDERKVAGYNRVPIHENPQEAAKRRADAAAAAGREVKAFLTKVCKIDRPGISIHSFRHSNVSEWEAEGWPEIVGMACSGTVNPENYRNYASAILEHFQSISRDTHDFWAHADKERIHIFTLRQLHEALVAVIQKSKDETIQTMANLHIAGLEAIKKANEMEIAEFRKCHDIQVAKLDQILDAQFSHALTQRDDTRTISALLGAVLDASLSSAKGENSPPVKTGVPVRVDCYLNIPPLIDGGFLEASAELDSTGKPTLLLTGCKHG